MACADAPVWPLSDVDVTEALDAVHAAEQALTAVKLHLVREVDSRELPAAQHATSCAAWLRGRLRVAMPTARRLVELSRAVEERPDLDRALSAGAINVEQAVVVDACVGQLPIEVGIEATSKAETLLINWAADFDPHALRRLGGRILEHVAPEVAERVEAAALAREEARAYETRTLSLMASGDGRFRLTGWLDAEAAAVVNAALDPLCTPRHTVEPHRLADAAGLAAGRADADAGTGPRGAEADDRTPGQRRADALLEVCRLVLGTGELPVNGGDRPQISVTITLDRLRRDLGVATLDTGERLTAAQARRLACDAQILPAVLGSQGQVLDVGQSRRLFSGALRRALVLRDRGCAFPMCDRPPRWCDGHHLKSWVDGGPTSLDNAVLLCGHHHRVVHHSNWAVRLGHDGLPEFIPPLYVDPHRRPRRNLYHDRR